MGGCSALGIITGLIQIICTWPIIHTSHFADLINILTHSLSLAYTDVSVSDSTYYLIIHKLHYYMRFIYMHISTSNTH